MLGFDWPFHRRRRADSSARKPWFADSVSARAPAARIEPTLPPIGDHVRIRLRYNDRMACAVTDNEAALHGLSVADSWRDAMGTAPAREIVLDVPIPGFCEPAPPAFAFPPTPTPTPSGAADAAAAASPGAAAAASPVEHRCRAVPAPTPAIERPARIQPTLSPVEHARRLLDWCRREGLVGEVEIEHVVAAYGDMCAGERLQVRPWNPVSHAFTLLVTGGTGAKPYANRGGRKVRVFRIPPLSPAQSASVRPHAGASAALEQERAAA